MSTPPWILCLLVGAVAALTWWTVRVYEPRMKAKAAAEARMFECVMARELVELYSDEKSRQRMLRFILSRRPTMPRWPEWKKVWGDDDPLGDGRVLH